MKKRILLLIIISSCMHCIAQNVGIGTTAPVARLHITDSNVLFSGPVDVPISTTYNPPVSGFGSRMMWYPQKAAFRVGAVGGTQWDKDSIGRFSFAAGYNTTASGEASISMGIGNTARGSGSSSMGQNTHANGEISTTMGLNTNASGYAATSMGVSTYTIGYAATSMGAGTVARGEASTSMGYSTNANGNVSTSLGNNTNANGYASTSIGNNTSANGDGSTSMGVSTTARGHASTSMGEGTIAKSASSLVIGMYNDSTATNRLFEIGNGSADNARSNAITVLQNGNTGIGTITPTSKLNVNGQLTIDQKNFGGYGGLLIKGNVPGSNYPNIAFSVKNVANTDVVSAMIEGNLQNAAVNAESIDLTFSTAQSGFGSLSEKLRIKGNGNIGIGTNNPTRPLSFPALVGEKILLYPGVAGETGIGVYGNEFRIHSDNAAAKISFGYQDNAGNFTQTMWLNNTTSVLTVAGTAYPSDERFKKQITGIKNPLQKLMHLNGVEYYMRTEEFPEMNFSNNRQTGLIAQEVEKVMPSAVYEITDKGYKGVDYAKLVPLLIESIKAQQQQIASLKTAIDNLTPKK